MIIIMNAILEIDENRGVIYVHSKRTGHTALRICRLPTPIPDPSDIMVSLDITHMHGCSWGNGGEK